MKRIFFYVAAVFCMASCELSSYDARPVDSRALENYGCRMFAEYVYAPVCVAELLTAFDAYIRLSAEEKEQNGRFYEKISLLRENVYALYDVKNCNVQCIVDTGGNPLSTGYWRVSDLSLYLQSSVQGLGLYYDFGYYYDFRAEVVDGMFCLGAYDEVAVADGGRFEIRIPADAFGMAGFEVSGSANEFSPYGFRALAGFDGPFMCLPDESGSGFGFDGKFVYSTFRGTGECIDRCSISMKPGYLTYFDTGR